MEQKSHTSNNYIPATLDELITDMELYPDNYKHLQIILNRHFYTNMNLGQMYLVVNNVGFGLYRLDDVDYKNGIIQLSFTNPATGNNAEILLDISDKHPQVFLINWQDIEDMVYSEIVFNYSDNELLELDNDLS